MVVGLFSFTWAASMADSHEISFKLEDYDYDLPPELIAQRPAPRGNNRACSYSIGPAAPRSIPASIESDSI